MDKIQKPLPGDFRYYLDLNGQRRPVKPEFETQCQDLDKNQDGYVSEAEFQGLTDPLPFRVDPQRYVVEHKHSWTGTPLAEKAIYPGAEEVGQKLAQLSHAHPDLAQRVSLGKTHEGRDIWALRTGAHPAGERPAVVITGGTHAREWASVSLPLHVAENLLQGYEKDKDCQRRLDQGEIWFVPVVNPDGYEYSREVDNSWRKNRRPGGGVDLNRNFSDGDPENATLWRPVGDQPGAVSDDLGASDDPASLLYRGPQAASEPEVQALLGLELGHPNVIGVLDNHNCGQMLLYPSYGAPEVYEPLGKAMNEAMGGEPYRIMATPTLYPVSGVSADVHHAHGIVSVTLESGLSFQPPAPELEDIHRRAGQAHLAFIDHLLASRSPES